MSSLTGGRHSKDAERQHCGLGVKSRPCRYLTAFYVIFLTILSAFDLHVEGYSVSQDRRPRFEPSLQLPAGTKATPQNSAFGRRRRGLPLRAIETEIQTDVSRFAPTLPKRTVGIDDDSDSERHNDRFRPVVTVRPGPGVKVTRISGNVVVATNNNEMEKDDDGLNDNSEPVGKKATEDFEEEDDEQSAQEGETSGLGERSAAVAAALLRRNAMKQRSAKSGTKVGRTQTSVGSIRSRGARKTGSVAGKMLGAVRTAAAAAAAARSKAGKAKEVESHANSDTNSTTSSSESTDTTESSSSGSSRVPAKTVIQSTINDLITKQEKSGGSSTSNSGDEPHISASHLYDPQASMGLLGERTFAPSPVPVMRRPYPGTMLLRPSTVAVKSASPIRDQISVRVATPSDDYNIANLRLSVFSEFTPDLRGKFCSRSCEVLANRRMQGAVCLVASVKRTLRERIIRQNVADDGADYGCRNDEDAYENNGEDEWFMGSVECSVHEFLGTTLGRRRPTGAVLYITEVAVSPEARRCGAGTRLLNGVNELALIRGIETLYLHVDVTNTAACTLYEKAGYEIVDKTDFMYEEFTTRLNLHDGATKGRNHHLLQKNLTDNPTWIDSGDAIVAENWEGVRAKQARSISREDAGVLGFEV